MLPLVLLAACGDAPPQVCSLDMLEGSLSVDIGALGVDPATVGALLCVEDDCGDVAPPSPTGRAGPLVSRFDPDIPRADEVEVRVVLTDPVTGAELYRGSGTVPVEVVEPNGPGCGESRLLPTVTADPDGTLRA